MGLAKKTVVPAHSQTLENAIGNSNDDDQKSHLKCSSIFARVDCRFVEVQSGEVADGVGEISEWGGKGLPLIGHPDNGEIYPN